MVNRAIAPQIIIPSDIKVKNTTENTTPKGVKIYSLDFSEYDVARVSFVFRAGVKYQNVPFTASTVAGMLSEGCEGYTAQQIADFLDFYGIYFDQSVDRDYAIVTICSLERFFDQTLEIVSKLISSPTFPVEEFEIYRNKRKQSIAMQRAKIDYAARESFAKAMYGENHYYGTSYDESLYDDLRVEDLKQFYTTHYTRENLFVVTSGKVTAQNIEKLSAMIDSLPKGVTAQYEPCEIVQTKRMVISWKEARQSAIRVGRILFPRTHPDFVAVQVLAAILGGYFGSRLISNLREDKGFTYGIFAGVVNLEESGYLAITTEVESSVTRRALEEIEIEIERLRVELVPEKELSLVKNMMIGEIMRILDGPFGIADVTIENVLSGRGNDSLHAQIKEIREITSERVLEMAKRYFEKNDFITVVIANDAAEL